MDDSERDKLAQETHQALLGIPGTDDKGLVGDVKAMNASISENTARGIENKSSIKWLKIILISSGLLGGSIAGVIKVLG